MNNLYESSEDDFLDGEKSVNLTSDVDETSKTLQGTLTRTSEKLFSSVNSLTSTSSSSSFSSEDSDAPKRIVFHIKNTQDAQNKSQECSAEFLNQISKNLKLEVTNTKKQLNKVKRNESMRAEKVANAGVDFTIEKPKLEGTASSQMSNSAQFMSSSLTSHTSPVMSSTRPDSALSNPSESYFLHSIVFEMDENNNRIPTPTMQVLNKPQTTPNAPPLPPLPANLQQKAFACKKNSFCRQVVCSNIQMYLQL
jgi:hypothetical protein